MPGPLRRCAEHRSRWIVYLSFFWKAELGYLSRTELLQGSRRFSLILLGHEGPLLHKLDLTNVALFVLD